MARVIGSVAVLLLIGTFLWGAIALMGPLAPHVPEWKAARDRAVNHQIADLDLTGPTRHSDLAQIAPKESLIGKHLRVPKKTGQALIPSDLAPDPVFVVGEKGSGIWKYSIKDAPHLADGIDLGVWVNLCTAKETLGKVVTTCSRLPFQVEAIHLSTTDPYIALRVCRCQRPTLAASSRHLLASCSQPSTLAGVASTDPRTAFSPSGGGCARKNSVGVDRLTITSSITG